MGGLPDDVLLFVKERFSPPDHHTVFGVLEAAAVATPRVMRAVLFLADGDLSRLNQYVEECEADVRRILTSAEYVLDADDRPVRVRDLSLPFADDSNVGAGSFDGTFAVVAPPPGNPRPVAARKSRNFHSHLVHQSFKLGEVTYLIASAQPHRNHVSCYRKSGTVVRLVKLPLLFVLEQLAERIDLEATQL